MSSYWPLAWLFVGILAALIEGATVQLVSIWFALSAAVTAVATMALDLDFSFQLMLFSLLGLLLLVATRPFVKRKMRVKKECTNADMVIGKVGMVTRPLGDAFTGGRVSVTGMDWSARTADGAPLDEGARVVVKAIEGVMLIVEKAPHTD